MKNDFSLSSYGFFKAALMDIFSVTPDQKIMCNV